MKNIFATIEEAIAELKSGNMVILVDDEERENEGDLVIAADFITDKSINFMSKFGRGLICLPMSADMVDRLNLPMMSFNNRSPYGTAFTVSIEAATGVSTGISALDRARTVQVAIDSSSGPNDVISPGHVFPLRARTGGVLERRGQTEGSVDLMRLAGLTPAAVICEIINEDGSMSRRDELAAFAKEHHLLMVSIHSLIEYRILHENLVDVDATSRIPLRQYGDFEMTVYRNELDDREHFALVKEPVSPEAPLVRIHSECITGDVFGSCKCDCGAQLDESLARIAKEGGVLIYLRQEGRGIGLANKLKAYALQEQGYDTVDANVELGLPVDARNYAVAFQILKHMGVHSVKLLTNNPQKVAAISQYGINVCERVALTVVPTDENRAYLRTKQEKLGHLIAVK